MKVFIITLFSIFFFAEIFGQTLIGPEQAIIDFQSANTNSSSVSSADVNGDGYLDIIASIGHLIAWFENDGEGYFRFPNFIAEGVSSGQVISLDADGDGDMDVLSSDYITDKVTWFENDGDGHFFAEHIIVEDIDRIKSIYTCDLDGDGRVDVLVALELEHTIAWYQNNGNGEYSGQRTISTIAGGASAVHAEDLDNDGDLDVISGSILDGKVAWYENFGTGNFGDQQIIHHAVYGIRKVNAKDLDGDGDNDVLSASEYDNKIAWYENYGNGNFSDQQIISDSAHNTRTLYIEDLDSDGDYDVITGQATNGILSWYSNDGNGAFSSAQPFPNENRNARDVHSGDFNGDGVPDILVAGYVGLYLNESNGNFSNFQDIIPSVSHARSVATGDLDNDGDIDVLSAASREIAWYENNGQEIFSIQRVIHQGVEDAYSVYAVDLNNDDHLDVLVSSDGDVNIAWYQNDGNAHFGPQQIISTEMDHCRDLFTGDFDNDGDVDIVSASVNDDKIAWYENDGTGSFSDQNIISTDAEQPYSVFCADLDGDSDLDVISASRRDDKIAWYANDGNGNFSSELVITNDLYRPVTVHADDLDEDGHVDILSASSYDDKVVWFKNMGNGSFSSERVIGYNAVSPSAVYTIDLDKDGDADVLSALNGPNEIVWYSNDGYGNFSDKMIISNDAHTVWTLHDSDMDNDGDLDILAASYADHKIVWFENLHEAELTTVRGQIYWDENEDGQFNGIDEALMGHQVRLDPGAIKFYTDEEGMFTAFTDDVGIHHLQTVFPTEYDCGTVINYNLEVPVSQSFTFDYQPLLDLQQDFIFSKNSNVCRSISGIVFDDVNQNGIRETGENVVNGILINESTTGQNVYTDSDGSYSLSVPTSESLYFTLVPQAGSTGSGNCSLSSLDYSQTFPFGSSGHQISPDIIDINSLDFGISINSPPNYDVGIYSLVVQYGNVPGTIFNGWMDFKSNGNITDPCILHVEHHPSISLLNSSIPPTDVGSTYVEWFFTPGTIPEWYCMQWEWHLDSTVFEGEILHWSASYECIQNDDACPDNNTMETDVEVILGEGRYALQSARLYSVDAKGIKAENISNDELLSYIITFQNPLPITAYNITILNQLADEFDINTVSKPFSSFTDHEFVINEDGLLRWELSDINLSSMHVDELNSYGFVQFNVRLRDNLPLGTIITNKASLIFNHVEIHETNEIVHRIETVLSAEDDYANTLEASLFPNPSNSQSTFSLDENLHFAYDLKLFDILGYEVKSFVNQTGIHTTFDIHSLPAGIYVLNLYHSTERDRLGSWKLVIN